MKHFYKYLFSQTARHTYITTIANVIYGFLTVGFFILASRSLGPEQFGLLSIALAIYTIGFDVFNLGTSQALLRFVSVALGKNQPAQASQYSQLILRLRFIETISLLIIAFFTSKILAINLYHQPSLTFPIALAIAAIGGVLLADYFITLLRAHDRFTQAAILTILNAGIKLSLFYLATFLFQPTLNLTTLIFIISPALVALIAWPLAPKLPLPASAPLVSASELFHFSKWMALWGIAASLASRVDIILLGKLASAHETGIYSAALKIANGFTLIGSSLSTVLTPKISRLVHQPEQLKSRFIQISQLVVIMSFGMIGVASLSRWFIPLLFGTSYREAIPIFYGLTVAAIFFILALPANVTLLALGYSKWIGLLSVAQLIIVTLIGLLAIPQLGGQGAALALTISYLAVFVFSTLYAIKKVFA